MNEFCTGDLINFSYCRYYYDKNILSKVHGKRYAYKFDFQALLQQSCQAAVASGSAGAATTTTPNSSPPDYAKFNCPFFTPHAVMGVNPGGSVGASNHPYFHHQHHPHFPTAHPHWPVYLNNR